LEVQPSLVSKPKGIVTHYIHVVYYGGEVWNNYLNFRDYLNTNISITREYESLKTALANKKASSRDEYHDGKNDFIEKTLANAEIWRLQQNDITL